MMGGGKGKITSHGEDEYRFLADLYMVMVK